MQGNIDSTGLDSPGPHRFSSAPSARLLRNRTAPPPSAGEHTQEQVPGCHSWSAEEHVQGKVRVLLIAAGEHAQNRVQARR